MLFRDKIKNQNPPNTAKGNSQKEESSIQKNNFFNKTYQKPFFRQNSIKEQSNPKNKNPSNSNNIRAIYQNTSKNSTSIRLSITKQLNKNFFSLIENNKTNKPIEPFLPHLKNGENRKTISKRYILSSKPKSRENLNQEVNLYTSINEDIINYNLPKKSDNFFTYIIRPENCGYLIKKCFEHRKNWRELIDLNQIDFNFKWQQSSRNINYSTLSKIGRMKQMVNHFEYHSLLTNKANLFLNLLKHAECKDENVFKYLPFTILFEYNNDRYFKNFEKFEFLFNNIQQFLVDFKEMDEYKYKLMKNRLYSNLFPFNDRLGNKTAINIPESQLNISKDKKRNNLWLVKPPDLNRGICIQVVDNINAIKKYINNYNKGIQRGYHRGRSSNSNNSNKINNNPENRILSSYVGNRSLSYKKSFNLNINTNNNLNSSSNDASLNVKQYKINENNKKNDDPIYHQYRSSIIVIQKYIEKPLLYFGRKFDIRIWVLLTHDLQVYMFNEGHLKCCSVDYNLNSEDNYCHLTNYSFQKHNFNFGKYEIGNEVSFDDLQRNIDINYNKQKDFRKDIIPKIKNIIKFCFQSVKHKINGLNRNYTFEIFGFDFMIDYNFEPFLIEINMNPGLEESSPLIKMLIPRMLDDALRLTVDKEFDTIYDLGEGVEKHASDHSIPYQSPFHVNGYFNSENLFKFICDLNIDEETNKKSFKYKNLHINTRCGKIF